MKRKKEKTERKKTHKIHMILKERFLIGRKRTKRANFRGSPVFRATYNIKTEKTNTINSTYLDVYQLNVGGWRKETGEKEDRQERKKPGKL